MKVAVLGSEGQLGSSLVKILEQSNFKVLKFSKKDCDITDQDSLDKLFEENHFHVLINCAAYTNVPQAETDRGKCFLINAECLKKISSLCLSYSVHLIHFSTDFIFDGKSSTPYFEDSEPNPINFYGWSKLEGEEVIKNILSESKLFTIFRVQWLYSNNQNNFFTKIKNAITTKGSIQLVEDELGSPCSADFISSVVTLCLRSPNYLKFRGEIFNLTHDNYCSRYDSGRYFLSKLGFSDESIKPVSNLPDQNNLKRPKHTVLNNSKILVYLGMKSLRTWEYDLDIFMDKYYKKEN
jgi:dTDP-4-dehydrorhamnose reductase